MDGEAFLRVFREIVDLTKSLDGCKVLLDLQDATCDSGLDDLGETKIAREIFPQTVISQLKLAMLTTQLPEQFARLSLLKGSVSQLGIEVGVFYEEKQPIE